MKTALITGVTGQDGSYLAELLVEKGYDVHGLLRPTAAETTTYIDHLPLSLHHGDLTDPCALHRLLEIIAPDEIYNLGAMSHVKTSFEMPEYTAQVDALGTLRLLEACRTLGLEARFYQASSSELFGRASSAPQNEATPFAPCSPYATAKLFAYWTTRNYRDAYGFHASNGILFNHESPRRGPAFVTRKITRAATRIAAGLQETLVLGNLDAQRDWGYAPDYVEGIWRILQHDTPDDFVLATGRTTSVRTFVELAFACVGIAIEWEEERGVCAKSGRTLVTVDPRYLRPSEVDRLVGDSSKAKRLLGWQPTTTLEELVALMVEADDLCTV